MISQHAARDRLLAAALEYVIANGVSGLTLRALADAIGTSHRMLIYHFGSKEGVLVAVIRAVEAAQRQFFADLTATDPLLSPGDGIRQMWRHFTDPSLGPHERLFFEIYGQALQRRPGPRACSTISSMPGSNPSPPTLSSTECPRTSL